MLANFEYKCVAHCHPEDLWEVFHRIEQWNQWSNTFGQAGWIHGNPWEDGSRFFVEVLEPSRVDLEVVVQKCESPQRVSMLAHGAGLAAQKLVSFESEGESSTRMYAHHLIVGGNADHEKLHKGFADFYQRWFETLAIAAEKHCLEFAL